MGKLFCDSNLLVYAYDSTQGKKHDFCREFVEKGFEGGELVVSNQVLAEFVLVSTSKVGVPIDADNAAVITEGIVRSPDWTKIAYDAGTVAKAARISKQTGAHFWDALVAATMIENGVFEIITENEKDFKKIPGIKVRNPFSKK